MQWDCEVGDLSEAEVEEQVVAIQADIDLALARQAELLARWDGERLWARDGSRSASACYARKTGLSSGDAGRLMWRARRLRSMALTACSFSSGAMGSSFVDLLCRANRPEASPSFVRDEALILSSISGLGYSDAHRAVAYWSSAADDARGGTRAQRLMDNRRAHCSQTLDDTFDLSALFDPIGGEIFWQELERIEMGFFNSDWAEAKEIHGQDTRFEHLKRSNPQRRCDALVEMAKRSAANSAKQAKPLISILVDYNSWEKVCESANGTVLSPTQIVPLLSTADIERITFDGRTRVLEVSRSRSFTGAMRKAIAVRDRHCQFPGCDVPAWKCDVDHLKAYSVGGMTEAENGQVMCPPHNRWKGTGAPP